MNIKSSHPGSLIFASIICLLLLSCNDKDKSTIEGPPEESIPLQGTWQLLSETRIENGDTVFTPSSMAQSMIKIINQTHFAFLRHDLKQGKDSLQVFVAGGGTYRLNGNQYRENLEYCNFREWENHSFDFSVSLERDTLTQTGRENVEGAGVDRIIIEKYARVQR
jgi:hypothetical protein